MEFDGTIIWIIFHHLLKKMKMANSVMYILPQFFLKVKCSFFCCKSEGGTDFASLILCLRITRGMCLAYTEHQIYSITAYLLGSWHTWRSPADSKVQSWGTITPHWIGFHRLTPSHAVLIKSWVASRTELGSLSRLHFRINLHFQLVQRNYVEWVGYGCR